MGGGSPMLKAGLSLHQAIRFPPRLSPWASLRRSRLKPNRSGIARSNCSTPPLGRRRCRCCINARSWATNAARQRSAFVFRTAMSSKRTTTQRRTGSASQYALAGMYQEGEGGLPHDDAKATELLIKSANQGFYKAQYALAFQYELGDGVPRSRPKAIELFRSSGDGIRIAEALADPKAPARFTDMIAFARYLASLRNLEEAASWQQYLNTLPKDGGGCHDAGCALHNFNLAHWKNSG